MIAWLFAATVAAAPPSVAADDVSIHLITFGPGDHPFFKFGHNAIWVHDTQKRVDLVYNYGTFFFDSPLLIPTFLKGKLKYWLSVDSLNGTVAVYKHENRTVFAQELALSPEQKQQVYEALELNALPANRYYRYDYYLDNCSTRVRDVIDRAVSGGLHDVSRAPAAMTWRDHTRRLTQGDLPVYLGLDIAMGSFIDKPIDQWEEMFLPEKVRESVRRVTLPSGLPLVSKERVLADAPMRAPVPEAPPRWWGWFLLTGCAIAALFTLVPRARIAGLVLGTVFGVLGCIFVMFWVATDHAVAHHNENIFLCAPYAVLLPWRSKRARIALAAAVLSTLGLAFKALPMAQQHNTEFICFFVPFWWGLWFALERAHLKVTQAL